MCQKGWLTGLGIWFKITIFSKLHNLIHPLIFLGAGYADKSYQHLRAYSSRALYPGGGEMGCS